jgi:23S rRNA (uracil1939-C5)-methyltransferase
MGFHSPRSNEIIPIDECLVLTPRLNEVLISLPVWLAKFLKENTLTDIQLQDVDGAIDMVVIGALSREGEADVGQRKIIADMCAALNIARVSWQRKEFAVIEPVIDILPVVKKFGEINVEIPAGAFLQPSQQGENALVDLVIAGMPKIKKMRILDLYAGCGTFAGAALAKGSVHAVEEHAGAVSALKRVRYSGNFTAEQRNLSQEPMTVRELRNYDVVILDPPRAGAKEQCEKIAKSDVKRVIAVSCNPATFARDAVILMKGGYRLDKLTLVDQFIWSPHSEIVGIFSRA